MKVMSGKLWAALVIFIAVIVSVCGLLLARIIRVPIIAAPAYVEQTRQELRAQGFKTDLSDFDFSPSPDMSARAAILKAAEFNPRSSTAGPFLNRPNLMEAAGSNSAIVFWKQTSFKAWPNYNDQMSWDEFRGVLDQNRQAVDEACESMLSGPVQFNLQANAGGMILLPHLAVLKNLTVELDSRTMLALHDGDLASAWTNLMAATRLVTAWRTDPVETSHLIQFVDTKLVFDATWQALQTNGWPDDKLAQLQREWESVNFFTNLPEIEAFEGASDVTALSLSGTSSSGPMPLNEILREALHPRLLEANMKFRAQLMDYEKNGRFEDEKGLLLFYRDRQIEMQNAIKAPTWTAMQKLPGVLNPPFYQSKSRFLPMGMLMQARQMNMRSDMEGSSLLGYAARAEAHRRLMIAALALQRYYEKHGSYPQTLAVLVPEFLASLPQDFMDGQPLRYRLAGDGHFLLYSIGLDGVDNGGEMPTNRSLPYRPGGGPSPLEGNIVWPLPATAAEAGNLRQPQLKQ
jgi:hypothetical protein